MIFSSVFVDIMVSCRSLAFSEVSASLSEVGALVVKILDLIDCPLSVLWFVLVLDVGGN